MFSSGNDFIGLIVGASLLAKMMAKFASKLAPTKR
jgi:hypothetical protein